MKCTCDLKTPEQLRERLMFLGGLVAIAPETQAMIDDEMRCIHEHLLYGVQNVPQTPEAAG